MHARIRGVAAETRKLVEVAFERLICGPLPTLQLHLTLELEFYILGWLGTRETEEDSEGAGVKEVRSPNCRDGVVVHRSPVC